MDVHTFRRADTDMTVKVLPENLGPDTARQDYVRVSTCRDPLDDTVTLATIERVTQKRAPRDSEPVHIKTLLTRQPMTEDAALVLATSYAERKNIEIVFTDH
jgi:hypothetical protein